MTELGRRRTNPGHQWNLYENAKTLPKWRTREWHLADAAWAPSQPAQNQMQGRVVQAADAGAVQNSTSTVAGFECGIAHLATQPLRLRDSKRKGAYARPVDRGLNASRAVVSVAQARAAPRENC